MVSMKWYFYSLFKWNWSVRWEQSLARFRRWEDVSNQDDPSVESSYLEDDEFGGPENTDPGVLP